MTQNTLGEEIERNIETFRGQLGYLFKPLSESNVSYIVEEHLRQLAKSIAEKTVEAVRVEPKRAVIGSEEDGYNSAYIDQRDKASHWLGKE